GVHAQHTLAHIVAGRGIDGVVAHRLVHVGGQQIRQRRSEGAAPRGVAPALEALADDHVVAAQTLVRIDDGEAVVDVAPDGDLAAGGGDGAADAQARDLLFGDVAEVASEGDVGQRGVEAVAAVVHLARDRPGTVVVGRADGIADAVDLILAHALEADTAGIAGRVVAGVGAIAVARRPHEGCGEAEAARAPEADRTVIAKIAVLHPDLHAPVP